MCIYIYTYLNIHICNGDFPWPYYVKSLSYPLCWLRYPRSMIAALPFSADQGAHGLFPRYRPGGTWETSTSAIAICVAFFPKTLCACPKLGNRPQQPTIHQPPIMSNLHLPS